MTAPSVRSIGAKFEGTTGGAPGLPAGYAADDIFLLLCETSNEAVTAPTGYTEVTGSPQGTGTAGALAATRLTTFWKRASASETAPTIADPGDHLLAVIAAIQGCETSGDPWNITAGDVEATDSSSATWPAVTTTVIDCLIFQAITSRRDNTTDVWSSITNSNLTSLTEQTEVATALGDGGHIGIFTGIKATAGSTGSTTGTLAQSSTQGRITIALKPPGATDGSANGATVSTTASIVAGAATGGAAAAGATVSTTQSIVAGAATGGAAASGATISTVASAVGGAATTPEGFAPGATVSTIASAVGGAATGGAEATGATVSTVASAVGGAAEAGTDAPGATVSTVGSILGGAATGGAEAAGAAVSTVASAVGGLASADVFAPGVTVSTVGSAIGGLATGGAAASGATVSIVHSVVPGAAALSSTFVRTGGVFVTAIPKVRVGGIWITPVVKRRSGGVWVTI